MTIHIRVETETGSRDHQLDEAYLRPIIKEWVRGVLKLDPHATVVEEEKRIHTLMRTGVKGVLIAIGDTFLNAVYKSKEHPRPGKRDDLIEWYLGFAVDAVINFLIKNDMVFSGRELDGETIKLTALHSRSHSEAGDSATPTE